MYNGIGLTTPRGTGTSGHVVRNASSLKPGQEQGTSQNKHQQYARERIPKSKPVDKGILEHERKRQIEVKCLALQDKLEEQGLDEEAVEQHINKFRSQLLENIDHLDLSGGKDIKPFETQKLAEAKSKENHKLANALRVDDGYVEGAAFDRELQELKRQKRLLELEKERAAEREERYSSHRRYRHRHSRSVSRSISRSKSPSRNRQKTRRPKDESDSYSDSDNRKERRRQSSRSGRSRRAHNRDSHHHRHSRHSRTSSGSDGEIRNKRSCSPLTAIIRAVEDGEPGEIEDIDAGSNRAEDSKTHKSNDLSDNESAFVDSN